MASVVTRKAIRTIWRGFGRVGGCGETGIGEKLRHGQIVAATKKRKANMKTVPSKFNPQPGHEDQSVTLRFALGEIDRLAIPMMCFGKSADDVQIKPLTKQDKFNAQGLEGAGELTLTAAQAWVCCRKLDDMRAVVIS